MYFIDMGIAVVSQMPPVLELEELFKGKITEPEGLSELEVKNKILDQAAFQKFYVDACEDLYKSHRRKELFIWLGKAIGTVKPHFDPAALHIDIDPYEVDKYIKNLCEAIELFCIVAIMLDDCIEKIKDQKDYQEFVEPLYIDITAYLKDSYLKFRDNKPQKVMGPDIKRALNIEIIRKNYTACIKYWIDKMFKKLSVLPNFNNEEIKGSLFHAFNDILDSSRFSRRYDLKLQQGSIEDIRKYSTNVYIESAKGGMGTQCMIPMAAMLLKNKYASYLLRLTTLIDGPGRLANDQATIKEEAIGKNANTIFHEGLINGVITLDELRSTTEDNVYQLLDKLLMEPNGEVSSTVKTICQEWEHRVMKFIKVARELPSVLQARTFSEGHFWFLAQEWRFCSEKTRQVLISGLSEEVRGKVELCLSKQPGVQLHAYGT